MAVLEKSVLSQIDTISHKIRRTRADFAKMPEDLFALNITRSGELVGFAAGKPFTQKIKQLDIFSIESIEGFDMIEHSKHSTFAVMFPKSILREVKQQHRFLVLGDADDNSVLSNCLKLLMKGFHNNATRAQLDCLADASIALLNARLVRDQGFMEEAAQNIPTAKGAFLAMKDHILCHIENPGLNTADVAHVFGVSARLVQKLFADNGTTLQTFMTEERLKRVAKDLVDPKLSIAPADIAMRWGFRDMTTFHRNFRRRYGDTPRQFRAQSKSL